MGEVEVDNNDRPLDLIKIISVEVLWNPFEDIIPRDLSKVKDFIEKDKTSSVEVKSENKVKKIKDNNLLSFGNEENDSEVLFKGILYRNTLNFNFTCSNFIP
jgi:peptidyl-prolyl cis-trans isomerase SDCCAG10